ncbi:EAL domain-containing protein [Solimonas sp. K1W22B-7]|uniref:EAL domain-containing protein n=1 Tax=Solimonas sp. K1W22B-7 TaxID=2303331 RepID=UPI000E32FA2E|nr:EAL domain-containing protein [Solimonas sp. K1W22B-7]AXQ30015.1 EAL domain-containing protein [Solimonas sp. K1W22B-7]
MGAERHRRTLAPGETLFREGDGGHEAYVVESGCVEIFTGEQATRRSIARLGRDDIFGEMTLLGGQTRLASAVALETTTLIVVNHDYLEERMQAADPLLRHLLRVVIARNRDNVQRMSNGSGTGDHGASVIDQASASADRQAALHHLRLEQAMATALELGEFQLHLQPIVRLHDHRTAGFEALIRWIRPDGSRVSPGEFIPIAEQSELIYAMGHWIIRESCRHLAELDRRLPGAQPFLSLNLSLRQFDDPQLFPVLESALADTGISPRRLRLEITESMIARDADATLLLLQRCKALGAKLSVDDFGTGYSSLSYLQRLPVDTLKLDRSFISDLDGPPAAARIVGAVARLARELGMETVAEGIETPSQAARCRDLGVDFGQGFHWSPALPLDAAAAYLAQNGQAEP